MGGPRGCLSFRSRRSPYLSCSALRHQEGDDPLLNPSERLRRKLTFPNHKGLPAVTPQFFVRSLVASGIACSFLTQ